MDINYQSTPHSAPSEVDLGSWEELDFDVLPGSLPVSDLAGGPGEIELSPAASDDSERPRSRPDPGAAQMMSSFLSGSSAVLDLDVEQLQTKIRGVLLENTRLRDSIRDSSASLRRQCEVLLSWRDENQRLRQERRQVAAHCQRARDVITQLRQENVELRHQLAQRPAELAGCGAETPGREPQQAEAPQVSRRGESPGPAGTEVALRSQLSRQADELRDSQREVARLQSKLARQAAELSACRQVTPAAPPSVPPPELQRLRDEAAELRASLESERRQRLELAACLAGDQNYTPMLETLQQASERLNSGQAALDAHAARLADAGRALETLSARLPTLPAGEPSAERLATELAAFRADLQQLSAAAAAEATDGGEAVSAWQRLRSLFDSVASRWEADAVDSDPTGTQQQVHTDGLQARILSMEELLSARGKECERLQRQVLQLRRDLQAVDILKAQVDVYQQDFNQERRQREQLAIERDQLRQELAALQARLRQLLARQQAGQLATAAESVEASRPSVSRPDPDVQPTTYTCPKCDMAFLDVEPLQNHANRCLDGD